MSEIYLVGGTTPRTDLNNYVSANLLKENAIKSMKKWEEWQGEYEDYHIDHIDVNDLEEHDKQIRAAAIDEYSSKLWQVIGITTVNCKFIFTIDDLRNLEIIIKGLAEQLKGEE